MLPIVIKNSAPEIVHQSPVLCCENLLMFIALTFCEAINILRHSEEPISPRISCVKRDLFDQLAVW